MIITALVLLGLCFGSFVNALVWRIHEQTRSKSKILKKDLSITTGRSMCTHCKHTLGLKDLLPIVSWLSLRGKCRYCHKAIGTQYPLVEAATAGLFVLSYIMWPREVTGWEIAAFGAWLASLVGFMALVVYDIRWMLLPNRIVFPLYGVAAIYVVARALHEGSLTPLIEALVGVLIGGGIFYLLFKVSNGRWIGGGDVKLGFMLGALVGGPVNAFLMLFAASLLGTIFILPLMATKMATRKSHIPFGPFLITACIVVVLFSGNITQWYVNLLML